MAKVIDHLLNKWRLRARQPLADERVVKEELFNTYLVDVEGRDNEIELWNPEYGLIFVGDEDVIKTVLFAHREKFGVLHHAKCMDCMNDVPRGSICPICGSLDVVG